jgi:hypothetical protein
MRNTLYLGLALILVLSLAFQPAVTRASRMQQTPVQQQQPVGLPNYDVRDEARTASQDQLSRLGAGISTNDFTARQNAMERFRNRFSGSAKNRLRMTMNDAGLPKMLFHSDQPLSGPQAGRPDGVARNFMVENSSMLGLSQAQIVEMKLKHEDRDQGMTFLNYEQTIGGISVFQGQVQMAIDAKGQVMSIGEGLLIPNARMSTTPAMAEPEALQKAMQFAGRQAPAAFQMMQNRAARGDRAIYRNPMGGNRENLLSQMKVMRVGSRAVLAYHSYVDAGPFDGDIVLHEYGHGVSNRLVGGPSNTSCLGGVQAGAMGEGWSDYWANTFYNNGVTGEYATGNAASAFAARPTRRRPIRYTIRMPISATRALESTTTAKSGRRPCGICGKRWARP